MGETMDSWYYKELGGGLAAFGPSTKIMEAFMTLAIAGAYSHDLAVFGRYDLQKNVVTVYFTPSASLLAAAFDATSCEKPIPQKGFVLFVGDARSWDIHFPGYLSGPERS